MTIQFPQSLPNPSQLSFAVTANTQISTSEFTEEVQVQELLGSRWSFSATWDILKPEDIPLFRSFLSKMRGGAEQFYYSDVSAPTSRGGVSADITAVDSTNINVVGVSSTQLNTTILKEGDYVSIPIVGRDNQLKIVQEDVTTDGSGNATINIYPQRRGDIDTGQLVVWDNPKGTFRAENKAQQWNITTPANGEGFTLSGIEWMA